MKIPLQTITKWVRREEKRRLRGEIDFKSSFGWELTEFAVAHVAQDFMADRGFYKFYIIHHYDRSDGGKHFEHTSELKFGTADKLLEFLARYEHDPFEFR